jgi:hypothetical protein
MPNLGPIEVNSLSITCAECGLEMESLSVAPSMDQSFFTFQCANGHRHEARESERFWGEPIPSNIRAVRFSYLDDVGTLRLWATDDRLFATAQSVGEFTVRDAVAYVRTLPAVQWLRVGDMYTTGGLVTGDRLCELAAA